MAYEIRCRLNAITGISGEETFLSSFSADGYFLFYSVAITAEVSTGNSVWTGISVSVACITY